MKTLSIILFLTLACSKVFCQQQTNPSSSELKNKMAAIDAYIKQVDKDPNLYPVATPVPEHSIYKVIKYHNRKAPYNTPKIVQIAQNLTTTYIKDNKTVYISQLSSLHDNYSTIKNTYFENDSAIYSSSEVYEEHILEVEFSYNGAQWSPSYTLKINKDSINFYGKSEFKIASSSVNWAKLIASVNLTDFDRIQTTGFRSYIDGTDLSYIITTDKRTHSFVNVVPNDPEMIKLGEFFKQITLLIPPQK